MSDEVCFQNNNLREGEDSEMGMARMIHSHTKETSSVVYVLFFTTPSPDESVGEKGVSMDGRMRGMKRCMLESKVNRRRWERKKKTDGRMPIDMRCTVRSLSLLLGSLAPYRSIMTNRFSNAL